MNELKKVKCKLCTLRYCRQQEWKKEFEKQHCATCFAFLRTLSAYEKAMQELVEVARIPNKRVRIYLEKVDAAVLLTETIFGKETIR